MSREQRKQTTFTHGHDPIEMNRSRHGAATASKSDASPGTSMIIEQKGLENETLKEEVAYYRRRNTAGLYLLQDIKNVIQLLQNAVIEFETLIHQGEGEDESTPSIPERHR
jgi:hypothetical protein